MAEEMNAMEAKSVWERVKKFGLRLLDRMYVDGQIVN
jgi:hypothetical protein